MASSRREQHGSPASWRMWIFSETAICYEAHLERVHFFRGHDPEAESYRLILCVGFDRAAQQVDRVLGRLLVVHPLLQWRGSLG